MLYDNLLPDTGGGDKKYYDYPIERYTPFGNFAETFKKQGWIPESWNNDFTEYKPQYGLLSSVEIPNQKDKGYISIKGGKNGVFDLNIKDGSGKVLNTIMKGVGANDINNYFTKTQGEYGGSVVNQRVNQIASNQQGGVYAGIF